MGRGGRLDLQRIVEALIGPQARDQNHPMIDFPDRPEIRPFYVSGLGSPLALPRFIENHNPTGMRRHGRRLVQQRQTPLIHCFAGPCRFGKKPLQTLERSVLCAYARLCIG